MTLHRLALVAIPALLLAGAASAQTAAGSLPNTFDGPARAAQTAPVAPSAPDIARAEEGLRAVIASAQAGAFDYSMFTDDLTARLREREAQLTPIIQSFGAIQTISHLGQEGGADLFRIVFANQRTEWLILFSPDDKIAALLFRPAAD